MSSLRYADTRFGRLAYREDGEGPGPALLLCQRFRGTLDDWDPAFLAAIAHNRRVIRFDSAGIGGSSGDVPATLDGMASVVLRFAEAIGLNQIDLLGWSLGGFVAQHVALAAPELIRRLIIAGSGPGGKSEGPEPHPRVLEVMSQPHNGPEDYLFLFFSTSDTSRSAGRAYLERLAQVKERVPPVSGPGYVGQLRAITAAAGVRERLSELTLPILVANGAHDVMIPAYRSFVISQEAPNARLVLYPNAGHAFLFQYTDEFAAEIDRFLSL